MVVMTRAEILALSSEALRVAVAEQVTKLPGLGYYRRESCETVDWVKCNKGDVTPDYPQWKADLYYLREDGSTCSVPGYPRDIAAAFAVVAKLAEGGYCLRLVDSSDEGLGWEARYYKFPEATDIVYYTGHTPAEAICRASLAAVFGLHASRAALLCAADERPPSPEPDGAEWGTGEGGG